MKQLVDDRGAATSYGYDTLDRQITTTFVDGSVRTSEYNGTGDVVTHTDENGSVFESTYDPLGRRTDVAITRATGVVGTTAQRFEFDGLSRQTLVRDTVVADDADALFFYDSINRVIEEQQSFGGNDRYVTHTAFTSYTATELTYANDTALTISNDTLYRKSGFSGIGAADWRFIGPNRTLELLLGNGLVCTQLNNARTHSAVQPSVANPAWGTQSSDRLGYDGAGRMITKRYLSSEVDGESGAYSDTAALVGFTTSFDVASNKLHERHLHAESRSHLYPAYDSIDRLLEYQRGTLASGGASISSPIALPGTNTQQTYDLDTLGNWKKTGITPVGGSPTPQVRRHNYLNQLTKFASTAVLYDHGDNAASSDPLIQQRGNGNIVDDGTLLLAYDAFNRLTTATRKSDNATIGAYTYDAIGRRVRKVISNGGITNNSALNGTTDFVLDGVQIVEQRNGSNSTIRQYVWGQYVDELVVMKTFTTLGGGSLAADVYYPFADLLYRSVALSDSGADIAEAYDADAYGNTLIYKTAGTGGSWFANDAITTDGPALQYIFTGREFDPESWLYFYRARMLHPVLGRFVSRDPFTPQKRGSLYEYANDRPTSLLDHDGLVGRFPTYKDICPPLALALQFDCTCNCTATYPGGLTVVSAQWVAHGLGASWCKTASLLCCTPACKAGCNNLAGMSEAVFVTAYLACFYASCPSLN